MFNGSLKATTRPRGNPRGGDRSGTPRGQIIPAPAPTFQDAPRLLQLYRMAALELMADDEAKRLGRSHLDSTGRHKARKRRDRAAAEARTMPEGRAAIARESEILASAGQAVAMLARAHADVRTVLAHAVDAYVSDVHEFGFASVVACRWALQSALFSALVFYLMADSVEQGSRVMAGGRSTTDGATAAHIAVAGFKDLVSLAATCTTKAQLALEMAFRAEDRARLEAVAMQKRAAFEDRRRKEAAAQLQSAEPATVTAELVEHQDITHEPNTHDEQAHAATTIDAAEPEPEPVPSRRPQPTKPTARPTREPIVWCAQRMAHVPLSVANTPLRSASVVPRHVVEKFRAADPNWKVPAGWVLEPEPEPKDPEGDPKP